MSTQLSQRLTTSIRDLGSAVNVSYRLPDASHPGAHLTNLVPPAAGWLCWLAGVAVCLAV